MRHVLIILVTIFFIISVIVSACSWTTGGQDVVFPEKNISYMHHVKPFLTMNCSYSPCHSDYNRAGGYAFTEYWTLMENAGFIIPGNPTGSKLVQILEEKMPHFTYFYRGNIKPEHIKGVKQWITEGAINN